MGLTMLEAAHRFIKDASPEWSHEYHIYIAVGFAFILFIFSALLAYLIKRRRQRAIYNRLRRTKW